MRCCHWAAAGTNAGINDCHVNRAGREERIGAPEGKGAFEHVLRGNFVADISYLRGRANTPNNAFHRADKAVFGSKICGERESRHEE